MIAWVFLIVLALVLLVLWTNLAKGRNPRAKIGPDGTNVREPETFVVHHEGKGQGMDIANTALKERTEHLSQDLPGDTHKVKAPIPGRDATRMEAPPSDVSKYGDQKVAPGAVPGMPGAESKEKVLTEGPQGSRPETPEEPGSPYAKGRRVTDNHRDVELASELLPNAFPGMERRVDGEMAASPSTNGQEPGYGLGRTAPGETDGEGGQGRPDIANTFENSIPEPGTKYRGNASRGHGAAPGGRVIAFRSRTGDSHLDEEIAFEPEGEWSQELGPESDWAGLHEVMPLPANYGEDAVIAMVRNPRSLYVYWDRSGYGEENLRAMLGDEWEQTTPCLRLFDVTSGAYPGQSGGHSWTIETDDHHDHWFINNGIEPGHRYVVSYERRTPDGEYYMLSHSGPVQMPHDQPADAGLLQEVYGFQTGDRASSPWR
jgi:hypothetical protein